MDGLIPVYAEDIRHFLKQNSFHPDSPPYQIPNGTWISARQPTRDFLKGMVTAREIQDAKYFKDRTDTKERSVLTQLTINTVSNEETGWAALKLRN